MLPDGATFVGEYVMGYNDKQLPVQSWTIPLPKTYMSLSVTRPQGMCVPVGSIVLGSAKSGKKTVDIRLTLSFLLYLFLVPVCNMLKKLISLNTNLL